MTLSIDFETASQLDLTKVGAYKYAMHQSTMVRCMAWCIHETGKSGVWRPGWKIPRELDEELRNPDPVHAWNAQFERLIFHYKIGPQRLHHPTFNQWRCTAALARSQALPGKLEKCAALLNTEHQKLSTAIMKKCSDSNYCPTDTEMAALCEYALADVHTEMAIADILPPWDDEELLVYRRNESINDAGIMIDTAFCLAMRDKLNRAAEDLNKELTELTQGAVTAFTQVDRLKKFLGVTSLDATAVQYLLDVVQDPVDRRVLEIRQEGAKSSTAKYQRMLDQRCPDDRLRGMFLYAGAGQTGRFSSQGVQVHNLVRDGYDDAELRIEDAKTLDYDAYTMLYSEPVIHQASKLIRPTLIAPPKKRFIIADYSAVEAKGVPWLAGAHFEIDAWASGKDRYIEDAANVFNLPEDQINGEQRQAGKVVRLACGFCGKAGALMAMAEGYGITLKHSEAQEMARAWHAANPWVEVFGYRLKKAAVHAVLNPGAVFEVGKHLMYACEERNDVKILRCRLPSGRVISYYDVLAAYNSRWGDYELSAIKPREGYRERLWHGLLAENVTQATCNDLLRHAMVNVMSEGYRVVAHVHDELVIEILDGKLLSHRVKELMEQRPPWAKDFPLTAKVHTSKRYTK